MIVRGAKRVAVTLSLLCHFSDIHLFIKNRENNFVFSHEFNSGNTPHPPITAMDDNPHCRSNPSSSSFDWRNVNYCCLQRCPADPGNLGIIAEVAILRITDTFAVSTIDFNPQSVTLSHIQFYLY